MIDGNLENKCFTFNIQLIIVSHMLQGWESKEIMVIKAMSTRDDFASSTLMWRPLSVVVSPITTHWDVWSAKRTSKLHIIDPLTGIHQSSVDSFRKWPVLQKVFPYPMDQFRYAPSQWETSLHCNDVSHCLGAYLDWSLISWRHASGITKKHIA